MNDIRQRRARYPADPGANRVLGGVALLGYATDLGGRARAPLTPSMPTPASVPSRSPSRSRDSSRPALVRCGWLTRAARLDAASTHWLRHTHISHALAAGAPLEVVQQNAGHASLDTTTRYVTTEAARRMAATQAVWNAGNDD
ncbi:tyrosine-type recombinase/integrase [Cupriavidus sp. YAF13]|uniref:tyrosine-type recombinase/integrase n=1 Tax=Cupriavidus sp. YAF13 TaxID=3233075 RepID=UPI003F906213